MINASNFPQRLYSSLPVSQSTLYICASTSNIIFKSTDIAKEEKKISTLKKADPGSNPPGKMSIVYPTAPALERITHTMDLRVPAQCPRHSASS